MGLLDISYGPNGHFSQCLGRLWHMPGGYFSGANFLSPARRAGSFSACVPPVPGVRSDSKEV